MKYGKAWIGSRPVWAVVSIGLAWSALAPRVGAEERKFAVMLAHSPKSFANVDGSPGRPAGGLEAIEPIRRAYFDRTPGNDVASFAEYWAEISYGDVTVSGDVFGWITLPWAFEPDPPNAPSRPSPANYIDLHPGISLAGPGAPIEFAVPDTYAYGAGEPFCDQFGLGGTRTDVTSAECGALIILDFRGTDDSLPQPLRGPGLSDHYMGCSQNRRHCAVDGDCPPGEVCRFFNTNVWTPGERFLDLDDDQRWDGVDEVRDMICNDPDGCREKICSVSRIQCIRDGDCPSGGTCGPDPEDTGPIGCFSPGCGNLRMSWHDYDGSGTGNNCDGEDPSTLTGCTIPANLTFLQREELVTNCFPGSASPECECLVPTEADRCSPQLPDCCFPVDPMDEPLGPDELATCLQGGGVALGQGTPGINCGDPKMCCEFDDTDGDGSLTVPEPWEDFIIRWDPSGATPNSVWTPVTEQYIRDNYPGDVDALVRRTGNGFYDPPDLFIDRAVAADGTPTSTKMFQDAAGNGFTHHVPKPGTRGSSSPTSGFATEEPWYEQFWTDRYGEDSTPPPWPAGGDNSPRMRPFDPERPVPPTVVRSSSDNPGQVRVWFQPNRGGFDGLGGGTADVPDAINFGDDLDSNVLPEEAFGFYDGWVEHDDLPSSKYHREGDKRLGEITSPTTDDSTFLDDPGDSNNAATFLTAIWGRDLGQNDPVRIGGPDDIVPAAGPYATRIQGEKGFDAGDVLILEWLTWRTDGQSPTIAYQWEIDNATSRGFLPYHPYAGPMRCAASPESPSPSGRPCKRDRDCDAGQVCVPWSLGLGFRDYNLDGMIDQGEVRPERSENYIVDSNPFSPNNGTQSDYPFNRRRMLEDVVEALDPAVDWDDFIDPNSMSAALCGGTTGVLVNDPTQPLDPGHRKVITPQGFVSGIVLIPRGATSNQNHFPFSPSFFPIHNEDNELRAFEFPDWTAEGFNPSGVHKSFNLFFHDLVICMDCRKPPPAVVPYAAHEYLHSWERFPDLYDYDVFLPPVDEINCPIGAWDIMAGTGRGDASLVHPIPILKEQRCTDWIDPIDLRTVLTPGVEATLTLPPAEFFRDGYFFLENVERPGERFYFWSSGSGFDQNHPGEGGMLVLHTNIDANLEGLPLQQRTSPFNYLIVQADGRGDLESCSSTGNDGDDGDLWPGSTGATDFDFFTTPPATWQAFNQWTGIDISNVVPDGSGSVALTMTWVPTEIPSLRFTRPPGGDSVGPTFQIRFESTDLFGGTRIRLFYTDDVQTCSGSGDTCSDNSDCPTGELCEHDTSLSSPNVHFIRELQKDSAGFNRISADWDLRGVPDGRYVLFAKLMPGPGVDNNTERKFTKVQASRNNAGDGELVLRRVNIDNDGLDSDDTARLETWTAICIDNGQTWRINSSLTQPILNLEDPDGDYPNASTCPAGLADCSAFEYVSRGDEVRFTVQEGSVPFAKRDQFSFTTTGITAVSSGITVLDEQISENPRPAIKASPLSGRPPLRVSFDARDSRDPNGEALSFLWTFGDGSPPASGPIVEHEFADVGVFTVVLRATNIRTNRFGETGVDITVLNNPPSARFTLSPTSGRAPLTIDLDASTSGDSETAATALVYQWDFGDGQTGNILGVPGVLIRTTHTYSASPTGDPCTQDSPCLFQVTLDVRDADGGLSTATNNVIVGNTLPVARVTAAPTTGPAPLAVRFNAIDSSDDDDDPLRVIWNFDDPVEPSPVEIPVEGEDGNGNVIHTYTLPGSYNPSAVVTDGHPGGVADWRIEMEITVGEAIPGSSNPRAVFSITPDPPVLNEPFEADASLSVDLPSGSRDDIASYTWDWGDGTADGSGIIETHTYTEPGDYVITLTVTDNETPPNQSSTTRFVRVGGETGGGEGGTLTDRAPIGSLSITPQNGFVGETTFTFDASASIDPDGEDTALTFAWDFGDKSTGSGARVTHVYNEKKLYVVTLTITDSDGLQTVLTRQVIVVNRGDNLPPEAHVVTGLRSGTAPLMLTFDGRNSFDPNGDPLVFRWEFRRGADLIETQTDPVVTHVFDTPGLFTVELEVTDDKGASSKSASLLISVTAPESPPVEGGSGQPIPSGGGTVIPNSADQRPGGTMCGLGMLGSLAASLVGLLGLSISRRRYRR